MSIHDRTERDAGYTFILIFALMATGIVMGCYLYYQNYERHFRVEMESELSSIAQLKAGELALWRRERLGDGAVLFKNTTFSALVRRFLEKPGDTDAQQQLEAWMGKYLTSYQYTKVYLVDTQGRMRMSVPQTPGPYVSSVAKNVTEILRSGKVGIEDFHRNTPDGPIHLAVVVPIFDEADDTRPLGVLSLHIDPTAYLYSFIATWPAPSQTAETLLVRRDGDDVLFLNELKFQKNTALNLRIPLTRTEVPAVKAALGQEGIVEGVDYRGVPVIAAVRPVPDSPWGLVVRMNTSEVYATVRERLLEMVVFIGVLLLGSGTAMSLIWRQRSARYRERDKAAEAVFSAKEYTDNIIRSLIGALIVIAPNGVIKSVNQAACSLLGYKEEELLGQPAGIIFAEEELPFKGLGMDDLIREGFAPQAERTLLTRDDGRIPVLFAGSAMRDKEGKIQGIVCVAVDISERKKIESEVKEIQDRLQSILDNSPTVIYLKDINGKYILINRQYEALFNITKEQIMGKTDYDVFPKEVADAFRENDQKVMKADKPLAFEEIAPHEDGPHSYVSIKFLLRDPFGNAYGVCGISTDITERKRLEGQNRMILERTIDGFWVLDLQGRVLEVNDSYCGMSGYSREELLAMRIPDIEASETPEEIAEHIKKVLKEGGDFFETRHRRKDGKIIDVEVSSNFMDIEGGRLFSFVRDITERKRARALLASEAESLAKSNAELERFNSLAVGREIKMIELKREINDLQKELGRETKYKIHRPEVEE